jgi:hypothetical protein
MHSLAPCLDPMDDRNVVANDRNRQSQSHVYIPQARIVQVARYATNQEHRQRTLIFGEQRWRRYDDADEDVVSESTGIYYDYLSNVASMSIDGPDCECDMCDSHADDYAPKRPRPAKEPLICTCFDSMFPLYEVTATNLHITARNKETGFYNTPAHVVYFLHPDEREHMDRYLAGTDDAMHDFVHELRYGLLGVRMGAPGPELAARQESFEAKKMKFTTVE